MGIEGTKQTLVRERQAPVLSVGHYLPRRPKSPLKKHVVLEVI